MNYRWTRSSSGRMWTYSSPEFGVRGTIVLEKDGLYHVWGISDTWGVFKTLGAAKKKVISNVGS